MFHKVGSLTLVVTQMTQILQLITHAHDHDIFRQTSRLRLCIKECISVIRFASLQILLSAPFAILDLTRPFMI